MVTDNHYIELYVNNEQVELEDQRSLNLRINDVIFNPATNTTKQATYSFSFDLPSTPNNDRIFSYANNLSKANKFHARYSAQVYADGELIFNGSLTVQKYNAEEKKYNCNLVNIKVNTLEEIFGDMKMTDLKWEVPFNGASDINSVNNDYTLKYFFPFVSYGVFQKKYYAKDEVSADYTSKFEIDKWNRFWIESFYPSLNVMEVMKKAFQNKGYIVGGSAFSDQNITNVFASTNLAEEQSPLYNIGNPNFGHVDISATFSTNNYKSGYQQELNYPYYRVSTIEATSEGINKQEEFNFSTVNLFNAFSSGVTLNNTSYMYDPDETIIVAPADGFYKVELSATTTLSPFTGDMVYQFWGTDGCLQNLEERTITASSPSFFNDLCPVEVSLVRNYDDNYELIKGKWNTEYFDGFPSPLRTCGGTVKNNTSTWRTCFPHEDPYNASLPTESNDLTMRNSSNRMAGRRGENANRTATQGNDGNYTSGNDDTSQSGNFSGRRGGTRGTTSLTENGSRMNPERKYTSENYGYVYDDTNESTQTGHIRHTNLMCYDPAVSPAFICGISSMSSGVTAVMKNGYSWSKSYASKNEAFYPEIGYNHVYMTSGTVEQGGGQIVEEDGNGFNKNTYINTPISYVDMTETSITGYISCMVWLNKNDRIEPLIVKREYHDSAGNPVSYGTNTSLNIKMTAFSDRNYEAIKKDNKNRYDADTEFPVNLNLFNFTNNETKVVDWINSIAKAFNLEITEDSNSVFIDTNKGIKKNIDFAIDIDDRVNSNQAKSEYISYPKEMSVQYKTDIEEYGFEYSVVSRYPEHINDPDWYKWGDSGFTIIKLSDDSYDTSTQNTQTDFSYTWYCPFTWKQVNWMPESGYTETGVSATTMIPVIEKSEYMADGYGYDEAMKHDGYSFAQRFWFRQARSDKYVTLADNMHQKVYLSIPSNSYDGFHLSYKDTEKSVVSEYFNISPMLSSNYVNVDVYLKPSEYKSLKGGAMIKFDDDLYYISEIQGYDPSGGNPTELKIIKKP